MLEDWLGKISEEDINKLAEDISKIEEKIKSELQGYDFINVNFFPFDSDEIVITFGKTSYKKYFFVVTLEEMSPKEWVFRRQRALLEFPIGHEVGELKRAYEGVRKGDYESKKLLSEIYIFALLLFETRKEVKLINVDEFLKEEVPLIDKEVQTNYAKIEKLIGVLDSVGKALRDRGLRELTEALNKLEEVKSLEDLRSEKFDTILSEVYTLVERNNVYPRSSG